MHTHTHRICILLFSNEDEINRVSTDINKFMYKKEAAQATSFIQ